MNSKKSDASCACARDCDEFVTPFDVSQEALEHNHDAPAPSDLERRIMHALKRCGCGLEVVRAELESARVAIRALRGSGVDSEVGLAVEAEALRTLEWAEARIAGHTPRCEDHEAAIESYPCDCCNAPAGLLCDGDEHGSLCGTTHFYCAKCETLGCGDEGDGPRCRRREAPRPPRIGTPCTSCGRSDTPLAPSAAHGRQLVCPVCANRAPLDAPKGG